MLILLFEYVGIHKNKKTARRFVYLLKHIRIRCIISVRPSCKVTEQEVTEQEVTEQEGFEDVH